MTGGTCAMGMKVGATDVAAAGCGQELFDGFELVSSTGCGTIVTVEEGMS